MRMVIAIVATSASRMNRYVCGTTMTRHNLTRQVMGELLLFVSRQLGRQGDFKLSRYRGVLARLRKLGGIPQPCPVCRPFRCADRVKKLCGFDTTLAGVIVKIACAFIHDFITRTVSRCGRCTTASGTAYGLY
jgi:hypothetical protein